MAKAAVQCSGLLVCLFFPCVLMSGFIGQFYPTPPLFGLFDTLICHLDECPVSDPRTVWNPELYNSVRSELETQPYGRMYFDDYDIIFWQTRNDASAVMIQATTSRGLLSLGSLMAVYGIPCSVTSTEDDLNLKYPHFYVTLKADDDSTHPGALHVPFTPFTPVASITVLASDETCATPLTFATSDNVISAWRGFRNVRFYFMQSGS